MSEFKLPLSGDVNQTINPWTWYIPFIGNQFGLVNISLGNAGDPVIEKKVLDNVGTYGRQLGRIGDVLRILVDNLDTEKLSKLSDKDRKAIDAFKAQLEHVDLIKKLAH